jgi:hypothetical protein
MKKTVLVILGLTSLLVVGLYAGSNNMDMRQQMMQNGMQQGYLPQGKMNNKMMKRHSKKSQGSVMSVFRKLNLSNEQQKQILDVRKDIMKSRVTTDIAFTKTSFDKTKFIEIMKQKRENMIESKAEMIDRAYKILTSKQKDQLKVLMDLKTEKMNSKMDRRMNFDKNCNGRR